NKEESLGKLHDRVMRNRTRLPKEAGLPLIKPLDIDDIAVVTVTLASSRYDDYALKRIADRMAERLRSIESVSVVNVQGGRDREIRIDLDPERLQVFGIPLSHIPEILAANNMAAPVGNTIRSGIYESVFLQGFFQDAQDVRNLVIGQHENRPIYLGDIANIVDGPPLEREQISRFTFGSGDPRFSDIGSSDMAAVTLAVSKKKGTNAVFMANDTLERIERMRQAFIPEGVHLVTTRNDGKKANDAVNVLIEHLAIAVFAVFAVLIVFLGRKEALIVAMAVPLILLLTLVADFLGNVTINRVSLFALILSLGLLVDDSIVVIENIHRHYFKNGGRSKDKLNGKRRITVLACAEVGAPSNLASFCIMSVFASLFFITGMPGQYFYPVAYNVPITMVSA
ncbi:MAG: efflux RND transporter permease subunit, partial [Alphaproteobacteria bacterium]|nr:efflux RND transporter permease subunit [Alphaproteobacteria bacterium]